MPRSLALLELFLVGKDVRVHIHMVHAAAAMRLRPLLLKLVYNEMVEFWGSLFEYVSYQVKGDAGRKAGEKERAFALFKIAGASGCQAFMVD